MCKKKECRFTYLTQHGSVLELIDQTLSIVESWADELLKKAAEGIEGGNVYPVLSRLSLKEKCDMLLMDGIEALDTEYGEQIIWQEIYDIMEMRPTLTAENAVAAVADWLDRCGWNSPEVDAPDAPEPLRTELILRISLDGDLLFLSGWFEGVVESQLKNPA